MIKMEEGIILGGLWLMMFLLVIFLVLVICCGCFATKYKPTDANDAKSMVILQKGIKEADQKVKDAERMSQLKFILTVGMVASIVAVFAPLGIVWIKGVALACAIGCFVGFEFITANMLYPRIAAVIGSSVGTGLGIAALYLLIKSLKKSVDNLQDETVATLPKHHITSDIIKKIWDKLP